MKIDDFRKEIKTHQRETKELSEEVNTLLMQHNIAIGKRTIGTPLLNKSADLFNRRERSIIDRLETLLEENRETYIELSLEIAKLRRAAKKDLLYVELLTSDGVIEREEYESQLQVELSKAEELSKLIDDTTSNLCEIGWSRYFKRLDEEAILTEIRALADAFKIIEEPIGEDGFLYGKTSKNVVALLETDYYKTINRFIVPENFTTLTRNGQEQLLQGAVEPCFKRHIEALSEDGKEQASKIINRLIEYLFIAYGSPTELTEEQIESFYTSPAENYFFYKDKVSTQLTLLEAGVERPLAVESDRDKKKGKKITTLVTLDFNELSTTDSNIKLSAPILDRIDDYDKLVINAVFTVWQNAENNNEIINGEATTTLQGIYRIITKNPASRLTEEIERDLTDRLTKLSAGIIKINASAEAVYNADLKNFERKGALMSIVIDKAYVNGNLVDNAVHIIRLDRSPLHTYAKIRNQIGSVELKKLDTKATNKNRETLLIEEYLIHRIEAIPHISNIVLISSLFEEVGIREEDYKDFKSKRKDTIKKIRALLDGYKRTGYIKDYSFISKGRAKYYSIEIKK